MKTTAQMQARARAVRARLMRPPNAVPDRGFENGKYVNAALAELAQRNVIEHIRWAEEAWLEEILRRAERRQHGLLQRK